MLTFKNYINGEADATQAIAVALSKFPHHVILPPGKFRLDGTLYIPAEHCLELSHHTTLIREKKHSLSRSPLIHLAGNHAHLITNYFSVIKSENDSPAGIVRVSHRPNADKPVNINNVNIRNITIYGNSSDASVGLMYESLEHSNTENARMSSNYRSHVSNIKIRNVGTGIFLGDICNAHRFYDVDFYEITKYSYRSRNNSENTVFGGFTHLSKQLDSIIKLEGCSYNIFSEVQGEPGGIQSKWYDIDERCIVCKITGHDNCKTGSINKGINSHIETHSNIKCNSLVTNQP